jgi:hypothetical protein
VINYDFLLNITEYLCHKWSQNCLPFRSTWVQWGSCYLIISFMCMFCRLLFVLFHLATVLSVLHRLMDSDYLFGIFKSSSICGNNNPLLSSLMTYHQVCNKSDTTGATSRARTAYPSGIPEFTSIFDMY